LRLLSEHELNIVAGGTDEPTTVGEIVVTAARDTWGSGTPWDNYVNNNGPPVQGAHPELANGGMDSLTAVLEGILADSYVNIMQAEQRLATQFNPLDIKPGHELGDPAWGRNGQPIKCFEMKDGTVWFDRNNNGYPDQHMRTTSAGAVWTDEGFGWHLRMSGNNN